MLKSLREVYDYILIDTAPLGLVIDAAIVSRECDGALIVVEAGKIKYRQVQKVKAQIEDSGCPVLGAVLNKVTSKHRKYDKYGGYYKHEGKEKK